MLRSALASLVALTLLLAGCASDKAASTWRGGRVTLVEEAPAPDAFVIERAAFERALDRGPAWFIQQVRVRPVLADDRFYGFQVLSIFPDDPGFSEVAIRSGDIVQRVNDMPIARPEQFMRAWEQLRGAPYLSVQVVRDRQPVLVTWAIR